jgi:hypothetical protein
VPSPAGDAARTATTRRDRRADEPLTDAYGMIGMGFFPDEVGLEAAAAARSSAYPDDAEALLEP